MSSLLQGTGPAGIGKEIRGGERRYQVQGFKRGPGENGSRAGENAGGGLLVGLLRAPEEIRRGSGQSVVLREAVGLGGYNLIHYDSNMNSDIIE